MLKSLRSANSSSVRALSLQTVSMSFPGNIIGIEAQSMLF